MATEPEESSRPGLHWPEHDLVPASRRDDPDTDREERAGATEPEPTPPDEPLTASVLFTVASRLEGLKTALATMGARVEGLSRSEEQFREFTTARLGEHTQQIAESMREISAQLAEHAKAQGSALDKQAKAQDKAFGNLQSVVDEGTRSAAEATEALDQVRQRTEDLGQAVEVLTGQVQAVAEDVPSLRAELIDFIGRSDSRQEELASELGRLVEEVRVLRRRLPVRAASAAGPAKRAARRVEPESAEDEDDFLVEEPAPRRRSRARRTD